MTEWDAMQIVQQPNTKVSLLNDLKCLGLKNGDLILAHASLSKLGWTVGREVTVVDALLEAIGTNGTLIMPSQTGENSAPEWWQNPPVKPEWVATIKAHMPPYDPKRTPPRAMGKVVEALLHIPGVQRSNHPQVSFCGYGPLAEMILAEHVLSPGLGEGSPLKKLYDHHAKILLLGVGYENCTALHLCESKLPTVPLIQTGAKILQNGQPVWIDFTEIDYDDGDFAQIGIDYEKHHTVKKGMVGAALCRLIDLVDLCDFASTWLLEHRSKN